MNDATPQYCRSCLETKLDCERVPWIANQPICAACREEFNRREVDGLLKTMSEQARRSRS